MQAINALDIESIIRKEERQFIELTGLPLIDKSELPSHKFKAIAGLVKWCTPSVFPEVMENYDPSLEGSVSIGYLGKLQDSSGVFQEMHDLAAFAYKNHGGHSQFGTEGSSGSNRVVLNFISRLFKMQGTPDKYILSTRNVHQSIVDNIEDNRLPLVYTPTRFDSNTGIFLPPTVEDIIENITPETGAVLISNPTYEGYSCNLKKVIEEIRKIDENIIVYIDEAWGSNFAFHDGLPLSGTQAGADIVVQSTHKQAGAPNQASIIHLGQNLTEKHLDTFKKSVRAKTSTTYSYPLINAMDITRHILHTQGYDRIEGLFRIADSLRSRVKDIHGIRLIEPADLDGKVHSYDRTKVNMDVSGTGLTGDYIAERLEKEYGIVTEKEERTSLCFLATYGLEQKDVSYTANCLRHVISSSSREDTQESHPDAPLPISLERRYQPWELLKGDITKVPLEESSGHILAENIKCYPPGIYVGQKGEVIDDALRDYLVAQKGRAHVYASDSSLQTVDVLREKGIFRRIYGSARKIFA